MTDLMNKLIPECRYEISVFFILAYFYCSMSCIFLFCFQVELERLNAATDDINKLEVDLDVCTLLYFH